MVLHAKPYLPTDRFFVDCRFRHWEFNLLTPTQDEARIEESDTIDFDRNIFAGLIAHYEYVNHDADIHEPTRKPGEISIGDPAPKLFLVIGEHRVAYEIARLAEGSVRPIRNDPRSLARGSVLKEPRMARDLRARIMRAARAATDLEHELRDLLLQLPPAAEGRPAWLSPAQVGRKRLGGEAVDQAVERDDLLPRVGAERAQRNGALLLLALADDEQIGDVGAAVLAQLVVDLLVPEIGLDAQPGGAQPGGDFLGIIVALGDDRRHHRLDRRQPEREAAGMMLDQYAEEALERAEDRAVKHHRHVLLAVLAAVEGAEPLGHDVIELERAALPGPADRVGEVEFELGRIEGALAGPLLPLIFWAVAAGETDGA